MRRDMPIRSLTALTAVKLPRTASVDYGKGETARHQDHMAVPAKCTSLEFLIALDEITPEMAAMRFHNGSHRAGPPESCDRRLERPTRHGVPQI